jgi:hypothetical protein
MRQKIDKDLAEKWRIKLAKSGFKDIEYPEGINEGKFRDKALRRHERYNEATVTYYRAAAAFFWHYDWTSLKLKNCSWKLAKKIWQIHAAGVPAYDVGSHIKKLPIEDVRYFEARSKAYKDGRERYKDGKVHKYFFYRKCKELEKLCMAWNKSSPEGLFWNSDF